MRLWHKLAIGTGLCGSCSYMHGMAGAVLERAGETALSTWAVRAGICLLLATVVLFAATCANHEDEK